MYLIRIWISKSESSKHENYLNLQPNCNYEFNGFDYIFDL